MSKLSGILPQRFKDEVLLLKLQSFANVLPKEQVTSLAEQCEQLESFRHGRITNWNELQNHEEGVSALQFAMPGMQKGNGKVVFELLY